MYLFYFDCFDSQVRQRISLNILSVIKSLNTFYCISKASSINGTKNPFSYTRLKSIPVPHYNAFSSFPLNALIDITYYIVGYLTSPFVIRTSIINYWHAIWGNLYYTYNTYWKSLKRKDLCIDLYWMGYKITGQNGKIPSLLQNVFSGTNRG